MGFWGVEVKPKKKVDPFASPSASGRLRITQAILGPGSSAEKAILQCFTDPERSIYLCVLTPDKTDSCSLDLEFDEDDNVTFSVIGSRSIHLSGYFLTDDGERDGDDCEIGCCGEGEVDSDSEDLSEEYDSEEEYDDDFSEESDYEMLSAPSAKSGVVIEEIIDDEKHELENGKKEQKDKSQGQMVVKGITADPNLESEDEDGFPLSVSQGKKKKPEAVQPTESSMIEETKEEKDEANNANNRKRDSKSVDQDEKTDKKKKRKREKGNHKEKNDDNVTEGSKPNEVNNSNDNEVSLVGKEDGKSTNPVPEAEKKNKKKNQKKAQESASAIAVNKDQPMSDSLDRPSETKPSQVRTFPNGLVIEELAMGQPDGKKAEPGKQVSVRYIGKLQKNGKIFDSNIGQAPFKFRLGIGHVIKGWDVGVNGMRIGDKRRLTIPPSMGYGAKGAGGKIPPNSWLVFDVELIDVR
ncbi:hypothetical protein MLD38_025063 [Melastoma candidum]|uniref:Uncharacterized protein n=1 Tax=Melastoma candidum TaxID=119954 RepID=A0ACB9NZC4_9MYRT|nr:hypothetical protein MLD38_025063 [Melastoma candidum]